ncbi:MucB/RseB C-terminal domain-containing protein [Shewanella cyperi]|uniref:MucB/RseB C-terminal domain-containing protein n=1 Tax=Shewanella cyperi TaxID=2814292 RepID=A0A974XLX3_9GAMM|nr:MucB/RseB C-terminal domain-containing protein [Shewanella cyperi]QSX30820.1 MucB/RseB C-terminal domain-containing protein [Shewanella cyperi]QSX41599.1 MucB/RseB C-terminal domain-containing protein [Shewanella cyperi]
MRFLLLVLCGLIFPAFADEMSAKAWLEQMSQALKQQQYKMSVMHMQADHIRPLVYLHGKVEGREVAFLEHLNGPVKNAVRIDNTVTFIEHDQPAYSVNATSIEGLWPAIFAGNINELEPGYQFVLGGRSRIAGRPGQQVRLIPSDDHRFALQVWLDMETFLPLRYDMLTANKELLEQVMVIELLVLDTPPALLVEAARQEWPPVLNQLARQDGQNWQFSWLPEGFKIVARDHHRLMGSQEAVEFVALTDGIAKISVYVARAGSTPLPDELVSRNGLALVTEKVGNAEVVAVGKVPAATLSRIIRSLTLESAP